MADVVNDHDAAVIDLGTIGTRPCDIDPRVRQRPSTATHLVFVDEAGPCGSWRSRDLTQTGDDGWVVAPALIPQTAGDRVNTARRDAVPWARLRRSGDRTPVDVPHVEDDAMRDLSRARDETRHALKTAQCRLTACLRRHDLRSTGRATGSPTHRRWLSEVVGPTPAHQSVLQA
jgi:transposase